MKVVLLLYSFLLTGAAFAQTHENLLEDKIENIAEEAGEDADYSTIANLKYLSIPLNKATKETLEKSGLFNSLQINSLLEHISINGPLIDIAELQAIEGFDINSLKKISPYITLGNSLKKISFKDAIEKGNHRFIFRTQKTLEKSRAYQTQKYPGNPFKMLGKYKYTYNSQLFVGFTGEKDAGEQPGKNVFDFNSFHLMYKNESLIKTIALGDYQLSYGQGLCFWSGIAFSKTPDVINIQRFAEGIKEYSGTDENNFMRGAAIRLGKGIFSADFFYSKNKIDANKSYSSENGAFVSSFQTSGYHRTEEELNDKDAVTQEIYGTHWSCKFKNYYSGITLSKTMINSKIIPSQEPYNIFSKGPECYNFSANYNLQIQNFSFFAEAATSKPGGACIHGVVLSLHPKLSASLIHRYYGKDFFTIKGQAFGEGYKTNNEQGLYSGITLKITSKLNFTTYYDVFNFPWLKYQVNGSSSGNEYFFQLNFAPSKIIEIYGRYKVKEKERNTISELPIEHLINQKHENYRLHFSYKPGSTLTLRNRIEFTKIENEKGIMIYQDIIIQPLNFPVSFSFRYAVFETDNYDTRIYAFENDVLYSFSIPAYYYEGQRCYLNLHYKVNKSFDIWLRYSTTIYENKKSVGSSYDEIEGNQKTDVSAQLRWEF